MIGKMLSDLLAHQKTARERVNFPFEQPIVYKPDGCAAVYINCRNYNHFILGINSGYAPERSLRFSAQRLQQQDWQVHSELLGDEAGAI